MAFGPALPGGLTPPQEDAVDSIVNLPDDSIPKSLGGELVASSTNEDPTTEEWTFNKSIEVPQASIKVSDTLSISEATLLPIVRDKVLATNIVNIGSSIADNSGSSRLDFQHVPSIQTVIAQPDFGTTLTSNPLVVPLLSVLANQTDAVTLKIASPMVNFRATIVDNLTGTILKYIPSKEAVESGVGLSLPTGDVVFNFNSDLPDNPGAGLFYLGFTPLRQYEGQASTFTVLADSVAMLGEPGGIPYFENEIHFLESTTIPFTENITNVADSYSRVNNEYTSVSGATGGVLVTYLATATADTIVAGQFTAGDAGVSNPTIATVTGGVFSQNDLVQINGTVLNDGLYEVDSHVGALLTVRGIGTVATVEDFTSTNFITTEDTGTITKVNVSIMRSSDTGEWEQGKGNSTPLSFNGLGVFGSEFEEFSSLAQSSTTSSSFQSKLSATTATKPAGKYRITFNAQATNKDGDKATEVEFEVNGAAQHNHTNGGDYITVISKEDNQWASLLVVSYITLGSPATIDLDINYRKDDKTARISDARIEIWRVA